ncbi:hypothetical protein SCHPADRAFT_43214 [Schizopora paradoxa]|uniref:BTB domain-containing protein n=1 Tax=Schizopora paradoxa TaxID=27342 RepID=A0A0H2SDM9_9AGAM|nr:hypothetical protein SCHPADRAFT_43214 [Schizopora paradoxa]
MTGIQSLQIRPPSPSYNDAVSLISTPEANTTIIIQRVMSVSITNSFDESMAPEKVRRHRKYYIPSGDVVFMVENTLFRVHHYFFIRESTYFQKTVFTSSDIPYSSSDAHPIIISDATTTEFARLLWVFYNEDYSFEATADIWCSILRVAHKWGFDKVKGLAVKELEKTQMSPVDKAILARDCEVGNGWLLTAYAELGAREAPLTVEEGQKLGLNAVIQLAEVREKIRDRRNAPLPRRSPSPVRRRRSVSPEWSPPGMRGRCLSASPPPVIIAPSPVIRLRSPDGCVIRSVVRGRSRSRTPPPIVILPSRPESWRSRSSSRSRLPVVYRLDSPMASRSRSRSRSPDVPRANASTPPMSPIIEPAVSRPRTISPPPVTVESGDYDCCEVTYTGRPATVTGEECVNRGRVYIDKDLAIVRSVFKL